MLPLVKIKYIEGLKKRLDIYCKQDSYKDVVREIDVDVEAVNHLCFWNPDSYSKINLHNNSEYSINLVCWEKSQSFPITYKKEEEWVYVVDGQLNVERYVEQKGDYVLNEKVDKVSSKKIICIDSSYGLYRLLNTNKRTITLHVSFKNK